MIKAVLFDFDGVLTIDATGSESICNYICKETGIDKDLFKGEYKKYNNDLLYGKMRHEEMWDKLCEGLNTNIDIEILRDSFKNTPMDDEMLSLLKKLKSKNYKTAMITDNKKDRIDGITMHYGLSELFDVITVSAVIGSGKDYDEIFMKTIEKLRVSPDECVFIDNQEKNLVVPKKMGMEGIFFDHKERDILGLTKKLVALGISI